MDAISIALANVYAVIDESGAAAFQKQAIARIFDVMEVAIRRESSLRAPASLCRACGQSQPIGESRGMG